MRSRLIAAVMALALLLPRYGITDASAATASLKNDNRGDTVILLQIRLRDLGYFNYKITGQYGRLTEEALTRFQEENGLHPDGIAGEETLDMLFSNSAKRTLYNARKALITPTPTPSPTPTPKPTKKPTTDPKETKSSKTSKPTSSKEKDEEKKSDSGDKKTSSPTKKPTATKKPSSGSSSNSSGSAPKYGSLLDWSKAYRMLGRGDRFTIKDFNTGTSIRMVVVGGHKHFDVEPATKSDTEKLKRVYGGHWSWDRRAILCNIGGKWYAGSMNGMPHGYETVSGNGMNGQICIHFVNSRTHGHNAKDPDHQYQIRKIGRAHV